MLVVQQGRTDGTAVDDGWGLVDGNDSKTIDEALMEALFPQKPVEKRARWLKILNDNEFEHLSELRDMGDADWGALGLPLAVQCTLKQAAQKPEHANEQPDAASSVEPSSSSTDQTESPFSSSLQDEVSVQTEEPDGEVTQVDCVVMDISGSMRARSSLDADKTREDVSKILFHTLVDKLISLELQHAVGLLAFGKIVTPIGITREYERFHDELGRLDANQGATMLYDAIQAAGEMIEEYVAVHVPPNKADGSPRSVVKRIFVLTDGEDNASKTQPWSVAQYLQGRGLILDGIPLAGQNAKLQSICTASGGLCFDVHTQEQAMQLFESEATLHLAYRELETAAARPPIVSEASLRALEKTTAVVTEVRSAVSQTVYAPVMTAAAAQSAAVAAASTATGCRKRVLKEFRDIMANPVPGWRVFVSESDFNCWKAILTDAPGSYHGGTWLLTVDFPTSYPFQAPSVRFITPIYHCNISSAGRLCLDTLKESWNPGLTVAKIFMSISSLLADPNPQDPLDAFKAQVCRDNPTAYEAAIADHTARFASDSFEEVAALYNLA